MRLLAPYPNPGRPRVTLPFALGPGQPATVTVYDLAGREVVTLLRRELGGTGSLEWAGTDAHGHAVASAVYLVRLATARGTGARAVTLLR